GKDDLEHFKALKVGTWVRAQGRIEQDQFIRDLVMMMTDIHEIKKAPKLDKAPDKRVELHLHTSMSQIDSITHNNKYVSRAAKWDNKAITMNDHNGVTGYPEAHESALKNAIKMIWGME